MDSKPPMNGASQASQYFAEQMSFDPRQTNATGAMYAVDSMHAMYPVGGMYFGGENNQDLGGVQENLQGRSPGEIRNFLHNNLEATASAMYDTASDALRSLKAMPLSPAIEARSPDYQAEFSAHHFEVNAWPAGRPLSVVHVNAALLSAGIENWQVSLAKYSDPRRLKFQRCLVLNHWVDPKQIRRMNMPVMVGGDEVTVKSAVKDADVVIVSDSGHQSVEVAQWISEIQSESDRPKVNLFILHGDSSYTANRANAFYQVADQFVSISQHVQRRMSHLPSAVIRNGVDPHRLIQTEKREEFRSRYGFTSRDFVVGFVGRFSQEKNPFAVMEAVSALPPNCKAFLVGFGHLRDQVVDHALRLLPSRFTLVDGSELENLGDHYHAMDALVMPSTMEGYGLVAMEAMMCEVPVIVTPCGLGVDLIEHGKNGMIVSGNPVSIAYSINELMIDRRLRKSMSRSAKKTALKHGFASTMARQYETLIGKLWHAKQSAAATASLAR